MDLTAIEGIDEIHALTLVSELGTDFTKWPTVKHFTSWLGLCPNWKKTGGKVQSSKTRKGKGRAARSLASGGLEPDAQPELPGGLFASPAVPAGGAQGDHGDGAQAGADRLQPDALRVAYMQQEEAAYAEQVRERLEKQLRRRARELGYELNKVEAAAAASE